MQIRLPQNVTLFMIHNAMGSNRSYCQAEYRAIFSALQTNFSASAEELKITHENFRMQVMVKHLKPHRLSPCAPTGTKRGSIDHMLQFATKIFLDV